jgi:hypothetical protein
MSRGASAPRLFRENRLSGRRRGIPHYALKTLTFKVSDDDAPLPDQRPFDTESVREMLADFP